MVKQEGGTGGSLTVAGWAVAGKDTPAEKVVAFEGERFLGAAATTVERPDVAEQLGPAALKSGFSLVIPSAGIYGNGVRVFAIAGSRASELPRSTN